MTTPQIAQGLASLGRNGDSVLVHMTPSEVAGLQSIAQANGTSLTINPDTGMPEAFSLGNFFKSLLPFAAGAALAPMTGGTSLAFMGTPLGAGLTVGALTGLATGDLKQGVMSGLGAAGGAGFSQGIMNAGANAATPLSAEQAQAGLAQKTAEESARKAAGFVENQPYIPNPSTPYTVPQAAMNAPISGFEANSFAPNYSLTSNYGGGYAPNAVGNNVNFAQTTTMMSPEQLAESGVGSAEMSGFGQFGQGLKNIANAESPWGAFKTAIGAQSDMGALGKTAAVLGPAVLSGIEAPMPGMTEEEYKRQQLERAKRPLNLNAGTPLNLGTLAATGGEIRLATGGAVAFDDGGSVPGSKLSLRREEEQMAPMQAQQMMQPAQTELGIAALKPGAENEVKIDITNAQLDPMQQQPQEVQPLAAQVESGGIPAALEQLGGQGVDFEKLHGRTQAPAPMAPMGGVRGFGPDGRRLAAGGAIQSGGVMDLYQGTDSQATFGGDQGYGLGRLSNLASQQSLSRAEQGNFAKGGVPKLEDGGFVVPADVVFYLGNHNTEAGQDRLAQMYGARPIKGPGTGLSDSIPTSIEGQEPAKIANGEAYIPRKVVKAHGGPEKFYKMMDKVRKKATGSTKQAKSA